MSRLASAFHNPVFESQAVFRATMNAMARPATPVQVGDLGAPSPFNVAAAAVALALLDFETPFWLDPTFAQSRDTVDWLRFHTGAPVTDDPKQAAFAFVSDAASAPDFAQFSQGTPEHPDRSTTIVLQVSALHGGPPISLTGPGIPGTLSIAPQPLPRDFPRRLAANRALFPCGVDLLVACGNSLIALPRSVRLAEGGN